MDYTKEIVSASLWVIVGIIACVSLIVIKGVLADNQEHHLDARLSFMKISTEAAAQLQRIGPEFQKDVFLRAVRYMEKRLDETLLPEDVHRASAWIHNILGRSHRREKAEQVAERLLASINHTV